MRILVTGASGFVGKHFVASALKSGHEVIGLSRQLRDHDLGISWVKGTLGTLSEKDFQGCDSLVHFAGVGVSPAERDWQVCFHHNVEGLLSMLQVAQHTGVEKILICGSCFEYGKSGERYKFIPVDAPLEPVDAYSASKAAATIAASTFCRDSGAKLAVLRPFHIYGEGEKEGRFWPSLMKAGRDGADFPMTLGEQVRDFMNVREVANYFLNYLTSINIEPGVPRIENIGSGIPQTLLEFAQKCWSSIGASGRLLPGSIPYRRDEVFRYVPKI